MTLIFLDTKMTLCALRILLLRRFEQI